MGRLLGDRNPAISAAALVACFGFFCFAVCLMFAFFDPERQDYWSRTSERCLAVAMAALAYLFGARPS